MADDRSAPDARPSAFTRGSREALSDLLTLHQTLAEEGGGVVVLTGPRGVGKGTLLAETRREMSGKGRMVLFGRAEQAATRPYAPFCEPAAQALAQLESRGVAEEFLDRHARALGVLLPGLAPPASGQAKDKTAFFESLRGFFLDLAAYGAVTLLLTDVHHADADTRDLIRFLAAHLFDPDVPGRSSADGFAGVMFLATRDDDEDGGNFVRTILDGSKARRFDVTGLSREDLLAYLQNHPGLDRLLAASRGRPEDVDELFAALPKDTDALLLEKISRLSAAEQDVLRALSVVGRPAPPDLIAAATDRQSGEVAQAMSALVELRLLKRRLQNGELLFSFARPHQEEVIFAHATDDEKKRLHNAIGAALEDRQGTSDDTTLAHHFLRGSDPARGIPYAISACERLVVTFAYGAAADLADHALQFAVDDETRFALLGHVVEARRLRGDLGLALDAAQRLRKVAPNDQGPLVLRRIGELLAARGERKQARVALEDALARLDDGDASTGADVVGEALPERALILATMADVDYGSGNFDDANANCDAALEAAPGAPPAFRLRVFNTVAKILYSRELFEEAEARFLENLRLAERERLEHEAMLARINTGLARYRRGEYEDAREILERALSAARAAGDIYNEAHALLNLGVISQRLSDLARSVKHLKGALALFSRLGIRSEVRRTTWNIANVYTAIGAHDEARVHLDQSRRLAESDDSHRGRAFVQFTEGDLAFDQGQHAGALAAYERSRAIFEELGETSRVIEMTVKIAWAALMLHDVATAESSLTALEDPPSGTLAAARQEAIRGATAALAHEKSGGDQSAALDGLSALTRAIDAFEQHLAQEDAWRALLFLADRYEARGDDRSAHAARERAKGIVEMLATRLPEPLRSSYLNDPVRSTLVGAPVTAPVDDSPIEISQPMRAAPGPTSPPPALPVQPAQRKPEWDQRYPELVGRAPPLLRVFDRLDRVTRSQGATVLIRGESGTGKELVAAAVHRHGDRSDGPFIRVNCAALVETLLLSELFGHEKGSFTGAFARKIGRFELARGGTIFLDEIGDISPKTQVSLLRVLQERSFERVGGTQTITTDAAVICATHRDLERMVAEGTFREDLYYRMRGLVIEVPALRDRPDDIPALATHFLAKARDDLGRAPTSFSAAANAVLQNYSWPGNIRELQNVIRSVALFCEGDVVEPTHLAEFPELFEERKERRPSIPLQAPPAAAPAPPPPMPHRTHTPAPAPAPVAPTSSSDVLRRVENEAKSEGLALGDLKRKLEFEAIANAMRQTSGNITKAAAMLKMKRPRLSQIVNGNPELKAIKEESRAQRHNP